jgi:hypothetical protein
MSGAWDDGPSVGASAAAGSKSNSSNGSAGPSLFFGLGMKREVTESLLRTRIEEVAPIAAMEMKSGGMCAIVTFFNSKDAERVRKALGNSTIRSTRIVVNDAMQTGRDRDRDRDRDRWEGDRRSAPHRSSDTVHRDSSDYRDGPPQPAGAGGQRGGISRPLPTGHGVAPTRPRGTTTVESSRPEGVHSKPAGDATRVGGKQFVSCSNLPKLGVNENSVRVFNEGGSLPDKRRGTPTGKGTVIAQNPESFHDALQTKRKRPRHSDE